MNSLEEDFKNSLTDPEAFSYMLACMSDEEFIQFIEKRGKDNPGSDFETFARAACTKYYLREDFGMTMEEAEKTIQDLGPAAFK
jgi:hypothetical protein